MFNKAFVIDMPTKTPLYRWYDFGLGKKDQLKQDLDKLDYKFVCGTNILVRNMIIRRPPWNLSFHDLDYMNGFILVGVGNSCHNKSVNFYTKLFYKKALSKKYLHSVRDEKTKLYLNSMGIDAINTGCVTLWDLTKDHCEHIPKEKSDTVVFTLTDYARDEHYDKELIHILLSNYVGVHFWVQGYNDLEYLNHLCNKNELERIELISPTVGDFYSFLCNNECEYIGTRLHAGIFALKCKKRSVIIGVDNRAADMYEDVRYNYIKREDIKDLPDMINGIINTDVRINEEEIKTFKDQFRIM